MAGKKTDFVKGIYELPSTNGKTTGAVARFPLGDVVLLPGSRQLVPGRKIVGATFRVRDLGLLRRALAQGRRNAPPAVQKMSGRSAFLAPDLTHGIWLEFRETR